MSPSPCKARALIGGIAALVVGLSVAAPAQADDTQDQIFLTSLGVRGVSCSSLPGCQGNDQLLGLGLAICTDLGVSFDPVRGWPPGLGPKAEVNYLITAQNFSEQQAVVVVGSAVGAYCKVYMPALSELAGN